MDFALGSEFLKFRDAPCNGTGDRQQMSASAAAHDAASTNRKGGIGDDVDGSGSPLSDGDRGDTAQNMSFAASRSVRPP